MNDTSSDDATSMKARVTKAGEAIGERVESATAATAAAAGQAEKLVQDAAAATAAAAGQAKKVLGDAGEAADKLGRKRAEWRRTSLMRVVVRPSLFRGRSASIQ